MKLPTITMENPDYLEYVNGKEVEVDANRITTRNVTEGDHIMVYKDTISSLSNVSMPKREMQAEYIGVEGTVTKIHTVIDFTHANETIHTVTIKKV